MRAISSSISEREVRYRNKLYYRFLHWPIWIFVFFIAPGPLIFDLIEQGFRADGRMLTWLSPCSSARRPRASEAACRLRIKALYHPLHRRSAKSVVSARVLYGRVGRSRRVRVLNVADSLTRLSLASGG